MLFEIGIMVVVFQRTESVLLTVGVTVAKTVPILLLGPYAGAIVDRHSRKVVLVAGDLVRALSVGAVFVFVSADTVDVRGVYAVVAVLAAASAFYTPASRAVIPMVVDRRDLVSANSLLISSKQTAQAIGFAAGGAMFVGVGFAPLLLIDAASFALSGLILSTLRLRATDGASSPAARTTVWSEVTQGVRYLKQNGLARALVVMEVLEHVPHAIWNSALMLAFTVEALNAGVDGWGYQNGSFYGSQIAGAVLAGTALAAVMRRRTGAFIFWDALAGGLFTIAYGLSPTLATAIVACILMGPLSSIRDVAQDALLQTHVAPSVLGRVFSSRQILTQVTITLSTLAFAWLAGFVPIRWIYVVGGCLYLGTGVYALANRQIRRSTLEPADPS